MNIRCMHGYTDKDVRKSTTRIEIIAFTCTCIGFQKDIGYKSMRERWWSSG